MSNASQSEPATACRWVNRSTDANGRERYSGQNASTTSGTEAAKMMLAIFPMFSPPSTIHSDGVHCNATDLRVSAGLPENVDPLRQSAVDSVRSEEPTS